MALIRRFGNTWQALVRRKGNGIITNTLKYQTKPQFVFQVPGNAEK
jgi:hypothetical protein